MPLVHSKTPKAFKENIRREIHAGKPQKQAVAIAYSVKRKAEHKADGGEIEHCAHGGPEMCAEGCYAEGGEAKDNTWHSPAGGSGNRARGADRMRRERPQEGVHKSSSIYSPGESSMGYAVRGGFTDDAKLMAKEKTAEARSTPKPHGEFAHGGEVSEHEEKHRMMHEEMEHHKKMGNHEKAHEMKEKIAVHEMEHPELKDKDWAANEKEPEALAHGGKLGSGSRFRAIEHKAEESGARNPAAVAAAAGIKAHGVKKMEELAHRGKERHHAEGGEIHADERQDKELIDDELGDMLGDELMAAVDAKDKKRIMESIEAIVMRCMNKE